ETDPKNEKISFGVKQLQANPLERIQKKSRVQCKVKEISESGILVDLGSDIEGFIPLSEVSSDRFEKASEILSVGQDVEAVVTLVDPKERKIVCSIKQLENELQRIAQKKNSRQTPGPALGQLFDS
ncbi:MAG: S1 RNA-binding domain-containing protein, partial [Elusimicrobia bacterium]|nr:S1 RNA-binding domain-containing protein [Elusimicrobiota bacterium]